MITRRLDAAAVGSALLCILSSASTIGCCRALLPSRPHPPPPPRPVRRVVARSHHVAGGAVGQNPRPRRRRRPSSTTTTTAAAGIGVDDDGLATTEDDDDDEALLDSVDESTLRDLCEAHSLPSSGTKVEMLRRLREYAETMAEEDRARRAGRVRRVEAGMEGGKARHSVVDDDDYRDEEDDDETGGYFYYAAAGTTAAGGGGTSGTTGGERVSPPRPAAVGKSPSLVTAPVPPDDVAPNADGERVVTIYSTSDRNDLTGTTSGPAVADLSLDGASRYRRRRTTRAGKTNDDVHLTMEQDAAAGPRRRRGGGSSSGAADDDDGGGRLEGARRTVYELLGNLLATTGAPAFQDDHDDDVDVRGGGGGAAAVAATSSNAFESPYGFVGFDPDRVHPDVLSGSSAALRAGNGRALREALSEWELRAIGHDGFAADDRSRGGGHYREVEKVGSFLEGYRKAEVRRIARETSTMMLDRLVKEGVRGLDRLLAGMAREGDDLGDMMSSSEGGELNGALVRYLEEAIRAQERRVKRDPARIDDGDYGGEGGVLLPESSDGEQGSDPMWNVTTGEDGTIIETIDPNTPAVKQMLREELEKTTRDAGAGAAADALLTMTVQEKILLLLRLLRDRVKVEVVVGNDSHARNLRVLAYALRAANDEERQALILDELGHSLDALDVFSDLITASLDYAEARSNDDFMPGDKRTVSNSPVLNIAKLQKVKVIVERIKTKQTWKASGGS
ncbi:hypothetical protein ACHAW5_008871 [Stephanodiscus triporus]|uniref:SAP domain-containing protein n=1 Tax=Stephanodiscus triporus TaxID=2934178 RepID=A0ABD3NQP9_9STRA